MVGDSSLLDKDATFSSFSNILDSRLLKALADMGFARPTVVQTKAIPLALEGRDILARARTGSGKTAAYSIPIVQKILNIKSTLSTEESSREGVRALILVPTKELSDQVTKHLRHLLVYCEKEVTVANMTAGSSAQIQRALLADKPDIIVATPARALSLLQSKAMPLPQLESLVIDEADLVLSFGHDEDIRQITSGSYLPKIHQSFLMSATMTEDVEALKGLTLRNPAILRLEEDTDDSSRLSQYVVHCSEADKFLLIYVILKLKLIKGKCILFVNDVDRCYRLKLFLEQFSIKSCVLNSELPLNSRVHIVQEFNRGVYDYIVATDESSGTLEVDSDSESSGNEDDEAGEQDDLTSTQRGVEEQAAGPSTPSSRKRKRADVEQPGPSTAKSKKKRAPRRPDKEYGVTRGVDFIDVSCVLNFDLPQSARAYVHRVGRTARAGRSGMALSFVVPESERHKGGRRDPDEREDQRDEETWGRIEKHMNSRHPGGEGAIKEYKFDMKQVEAFRYRTQDAIRAVTRSAVKEARLKELKEEILNSEKLKAHFEDNPLDLEYLRHDKALHPTRIQPHMKYIPKYLMPKLNASSGASVDTTSGQDQATQREDDKGVGFVPFKKGKSDRGRGRGFGRGGSRGGRGGGPGRKKADPLKKFGR